MDEPFGAIDPINREEIQNEFLRVQGKLKKTIIFVTHDLHEAIKMGDKIAILQEGRLIQYDSPEIILTRPKNKYIADFVGADRALKVLGLLRAKDALNKEARNIVKGSQNAHQALTFLEQEGFTEAVVIEDDKPIGYVSPETLRHENRPVREVAESYPRFIDTYDTLKDAMSSMLMHDARVLCVVDEDGKFKGTIAMKDIQRSILEIYAEEDTEESS
jgi:osmoprotectant transport system ATP-binding protein